MIYGIHKMCTLLLKKNKANIPDGYTFKKDFMSDLKLIT